MEIRYFYDVIATTAQRLPNKVSFRRRNKHNELKGYTYSEVKTMVDQLGAGLIDLGTQIGDRIALFCDASKHWFFVDCALVSAGGVSVPRGTDVTDEDIEYILTHSESRFAIVMKQKDKQRLEGMKAKFPTLEKIYFIEDDDGDLASGPGTTWELMNRGKEILEKNPSFVRERVDKTDPAALATLIYTSGTTGMPKGVMLNQSGWINGFTGVLKKVQFRESDCAVSLLPPWHAFERSAEYACVKVGMDFVVTDTKNVQLDLREFKPHVFPSVPRIWESLYNGIITKISRESKGKRAIFNFCLNVSNLWARHVSIVKGYDFQITKPFFLVYGLRKFISLIVLFLIIPFKLLSVLIFSKIHAALGGRLRVSVSGGSALPGVVDKFFTGIGVRVLEGYGLTETSAVISVRDNAKPTPNTVGKPLPNYQVKLKDDKGNIITDKIGEKGTLWVKSDQILMGYYKRPELNEIIFDKDGFFDTGDIMRINYRGELSFAGRAKDTIALAGGENIEPVPIEDKLLTSRFIDQVIVVGDDKKTLGVIIVPSYENAKQQLPEAPEDKSLWNFDQGVRNLYRAELVKLISKDTGFKSFEIIPASCFYVSPRPFDLDTEMTRTLKMKRNVIKDNFAREIEGMYK